MIDSALAAMRDDEPTNQTALAKEARAQEDVLLAQLNMKPLNQDVPIKMQSGDTDLQSVINLVKKGKKPSRSEQSRLTKEVQLLLREWSRLKVENGVLWRVISLPA